MSWEAFRWTAKSPSELYHILGPHGPDDMVRQMIAAVWRHLPEDGRSFAAAVAAAREVFDRNIRVWRAIKKPTPEAFFADLHPHEADGHLRKGMVLVWMMMPRTGGREVKDVVRIVSDIFERNLLAWADDNATFTGGRKKSKKPPAKPAAATAPTKKPKPKPKPKGVTRMAKAGKSNSGRAGDKAKPAPKATTRPTARADSPAEAKVDELAPLRADMERRMTRAGAKHKSSAGENG